MTAAVMAPDGYSYPAPLYRRVSQTDKNIPHALWLAPVRCSPLTITRSVSQPKQARTSDPASGLSGARTQAHAVMRGALAASGFSARTASPCPAMRCGRNCCWLEQERLRSALCQGVEGFRFNSRAHRLGGVPLSPAPPRLSPAQPPATPPPAARPLGPALH